MISTETLRVAHSTGHRPSLGYLWAIYEFLLTPESRDLRIYGYQLGCGTTSKPLKTALGMCLSTIATPLFQTTGSCPLENAISICFLVTWEAYD